MKAVEDIEYLAGETIKSATQADFGESLAIIFTDNTYAFRGKPRPLGRGGCQLLSKKRFP